MYIRGAKIENVFAPNPHAQRLVALLGLFDDRLQCSFCSTNVLGQRGGEVELQLGVRILKRATARFAWQWKVAPLLSLLDELIFSQFWWYIIYIYIIYILLFIKVYTVLLLACNRYTITKDCDASLVYDHSRARPLQNRSTSWPSLNHWKQNPLKAIPTNTPRKNDLECL